MKILNLQNKENYQVGNKRMSYDGKSLISLKWVCKLKTVDKNVFPKARLVAKGFEEKYTEVYQHVLGKL